MSFCLSTVGNKNVALPEKVYVNYFRNCQDSINISLFRIPQTSGTDIDAASFCNRVVLLTRMVFWICYFLGIGPHFGNDGFKKN